jgi:hypothetical protein
MRSSATRSDALKATVSWLKRASRSVREVWAELDYAQRRLLEIQTGVSLIKPEQRPWISSRVEQLEALYDYEPLGAEHDPEPIRVPRIEDT